MVWGLGGLAPYMGGEVVRVDVQGGLVWGKCPRTILHICRYFQNSVLMYDTVLHIFVGCGIHI